MAAERALSLLLGMKELQIRVVSLRPQTAACPQRKAKRKLDRDRGSLKSEVFPDKLLRRTAVGRFKDMIEVAEIVETAQKADFDDLMRAVQKKLRGVADTLLIDKFRRGHVQIFPKFARKMLLRGSGKLQQLGKPHGEILLVVHFIKKSAQAVGNSRALQTTFFL